MLDINIETPSSILEVLKDNFKQKRLSFNLTQEGLSKKSGVSLGSLKRFESIGQISLESLLKLALVLECLDEFKNIAIIKDEIAAIDDLFKQENQKKQRGSIK
ncbi:helix-turn-helix domain-containing protein [Poseidonibacter lekithochrous]|uniref:helix-turn-helix domain-containing protein n=1 Tax=Poseidonibacter TaxID=2321187 RepID=UPI001C0943BD|nr:MULTISPECIES: helix-turn-helix domain-containing protein [Poseidonibacter]MBU3014228.1 helix-turn-helix domain-containing protein [Poseidonibacter lekithochrous]MDO6827525.1 helix-turn-helix domain-containing protein [Poseidonibacter sp. 1_MG-2023]